TCKKCGHVPVPESELPLLLPDVRHYKPTGTGESPLAAVHSWVNTICPKCGGDAKRETNTMPQWAGSCWYYLRFIDPKNEVEMIDAAAEKKWMPVDCYIGGAEHAVLHLLYARFWHKVLYDMGYVTTKEPFQKLRHQGMIISFSYRDTKGVYHPYDAIKTSESGATLKETGEELVRQVEKMSKTKKNVVNPDDVLKDYGADVFRLYEMFMGPFADSKPWNTHDILGRVRFIRRVWKSLRNPNKFSEGTGLESLRHKTIKKIGEDIEALHFNTAISALDIYLNAIVSEKSPTKTDVETFLQLLNPFAPHVTEEIWERLGHEPFLSAKKWPAFDPKKLIDAEFEMPIQVNGKLRGRLKVPTTASKEEIEKLALAEPHIKVATEGKKVARIIVVPKRLVNVVLV
ncbi:MAG: leucine--tRNA ligase, partial [Elusimicrobia bacterium]